MTLSIITIFPNLFDSFLAYGNVRKAIQNGALEINIVNLRDFTTDKYKSVDDKPYGGDVGMILKIDILNKAIESLKKGQKASCKTIFLSPQGRLLDQRLVKLLSYQKHLILICGRYEGVDARIEKFTDLEISVGNYILSGGESAALVTIDAISRLLPGVLAKKESITNETFESNILKYPQYTRPENYRNLNVPKVLLSGDHKQIKAWQTKMAKKITLKKRPDLLKNN